MKNRSPRNQTVTLSDQDRKRLLLRIRSGNDAIEELPLDTTIHGDCLDVLVRLPNQVADLLILDPPYNLDKEFNGRKFSRRPDQKYTEWLAELLDRVMPVLKPTASVYICGDWQSSPSIYSAASERLIIRNRITWEREKGRGALRNWKNSSEDIWFCTVSNDYVFNRDEVMLRRKVIAPYRNSNGEPRDWSVTDDGNFRDTAPSNLWTDISVPFWSMPENTDHPTQKSEKLIARLILASTDPGMVVLDPFLGSGSSSVVAKKLQRRYLGIEIDREFCLLAERRLEMAEEHSTIQGFEDGIFWERNTLAQRMLRRLAPNHKR